MYKPILICIALLSLLSGCSTVSAPGTSLKSTNALPEIVFDGSYLGEGMRLNMNGNGAYGFNASLSAYSENGAIFLRETVASAGGVNKNRTYRITQVEPHKYLCTDIDYLRNCELTLSGDTIMIKTPIYEKFGSDDFFVNAVNIYQLMSDGSILKRTTYNKYLFFFNQEEIISYKRQ